MAGDYNISVIVSAVDKASGVLGKMGSNFDKVAKGLAITGAAMSAAFTAPAMAILGGAVHYETALNDIKASFKGTDKQFEEMQKTWERLAENMPGTREDFMGIAEAMSAMNVPIEQQGKLMEMLAFHAAGMRTNYGELATWALHFQNATQLSNYQLNEQLQILNALSEESGQSIAAVEEMMQTIGQAGKQLSGAQGLGAWEAFGATILKAGGSAQTVKAAMTNLVKVTTGGLTKKQAPLFDQLGIPMRQLQAGLKNNPGAMLSKVVAQLKAIHAVNPGKAMELIALLFGKKGMLGTAGLAGNLDTLAHMLGVVNDKTGLVTNSLGDYNTKAKETGTIWENINDIWENVKDTIGTRWLGPVKAASNAFKDWAQNMRDMHPDALNALADTLGVLALLGPGLLACSLGIKAIGLAISSIPAIAVFALIAAGIYAIYENWAIVKPHWDNLVKAITDLIKPLTDLMGIDLSGIDLSGIFGSFSVTFATAVGSSLQLIADGINAIKDAFTSWEGAGKFVSWLGKVSSFGSPFASMLKLAPEALKGPAGTLGPTISKGAGAAAESGKSWWDNIMHNAPPAGGTSGAIPQSFRAPSPPPMVRGGPAEAVVRDPIPIDLSGANVTAELKGGAEVNVNLKLSDQLQAAGFSSMGFGNVRPSVGLSMGDMGTKP